MNTVRCKRCGAVEGRGTANVARGECCGNCASEWNGAPSVPDPVADTALALARLHADCVQQWGSSKVKPFADRHRQAAIEDAARACGPQVYAAWCALVTGDAGRAPEVGRVD